MGRRKTFGTIHVRVLISFGDVKAGDIAHMERTPRVQGWIDAGLVEVLDGEGEAGPGGADTDDREGLEDGAASGGPAGGEPGEGFGAGGYGTAEILDQG